MHGPFRIALACAVFLLGLAFLPGVTAAAPKSSAAPSSATTEWELALFEQTNADRVRHGLNPVEFDPTLLPFARERAAAQRGGDTLSHYSPHGEFVLQSFLSSSGLTYFLAGENLARWFALEPSAPRGVQDALMQSPTHRGVILEPSFNRMAVGAATDSAGRLFYAQIFLAAP